MPIQVSKKNEDEWDSLPLMEGANALTCAAPGCNVAFLRFADRVRLKVWNARLGRYEVAYFHPECNSKGEVLLFLESWEKRMKEEKEKEKENVTSTEEIGAIEHCRSCKAPIRWLLNTKTGKSAPVNAEPDPTGNVKVDLASRTYTVLTMFERTFIKEHGDTNTLYKSHFATCPQSKLWRQTTRG